MSSIIHSDVVFDLIAEHFWVLVPDMVLVMVAELLIDYVKHAFITKFNELQPEVVLVIMIRYLAIQCELIIVIAEHSAFHGSV